MSRLRAIGPLIALSLLVTWQTAKSDEWTASYKYNVAPNVRWWTGDTATAVSGVQIVTNYGFDFKFAKPEWFTFSFGSGSGFLDTQTKQLVPTSFGGLPPVPSGVISRLNYQASGELDVLSYARLDLTKNKFLQPYIQLDYNASPITSQSINQVFAFSADADRNLYSAFGAGNYYQTKLGTVLNFTDELAADLSWKRNYGTRFSPYNYIFDQKVTAPTNSAVAKLEYGSNKLDLSVGYEFTMFGVNSSFFEDFQFAPQNGQPPISSPLNPRVLELSRYGALNVINVKGEYRPNDNLFFFAEGAYSVQAKNKWGRSPEPLVPPLPFQYQDFNANPVRYSGLVGVGYKVAPWTYQIQAVGGVDESNHANLNLLTPSGASNPDAAFFLPHRDRAGVEGIIDYRVTKMLGINLRLGYLHVSGFQFPPAYSNPSFQPANIMTAYLTGKLTF
jgi:hypothetical protein